MQYLTIHEIFEKYRIPEVTLRRWIKKGVLPYKQVMKNSKIYVLESDIPTYLRMAGKGNNEI